MATQVLAPVNIPSSHPYAHDVAVDGAGNTYISGYFGGTVRFGTTSFSASNSQAYVAKLDATGNYQWLVPMATGRGGSFASTTSLAVDATGNVYVAGSFFGTMTLGTTTLTSAGFGDIFVGKLDPNGNWLSAVRAGGAQEEALVRVALDAGGNVYLTGRFVGVTTAGATTTFGTTTLTSAGSSDFFAARLDAAGTWRWAVRGGGPGSEWANDMGVDALGHVYLAAFMDSPGGQFGSVNVPGIATVVAQLDATTGNLLRLTPVAGSSIYMFAFFSRLAVQPDGTCYLAGSYHGSLSFGSITLPSISLANEDIFVAKLTSTGTWQWASTAGGPAGDYCSGLVVDARSNVYVAGLFYGPGSQFGATTLVPQNAASSTSDVYVAQLDATGAWRWAVAAGGQQEDTNRSLALGPGATPTIVGEYQSPAMSFGARTISGAPSLGTSIYAARLRPTPLTISGDSLLCAGGTTQLTATTTSAVSSWRWNTGATTPSITVSQPGLYTVTATLVGGYTLSEQFRVRAQLAVPSAQITGGGGYLCPGTPRQLLVVAPGATAVRWNTGATTPGLTITQPGTYSVVASYGPACAATAQTTVGGNELHIAGRSQLCPGQSTPLTATTTGAAVTGYRWNTGATTPSLLVGQAGTYSVTVTFADGCQLTAAHVVGPPVARVASVSGDTLLCAGSMLTLTALNPDALRYQWNTGVTTPTIPVTQPGTYRVVLTYTGGCTSRDSLQILTVPMVPGFTLGADTTLCTEATLVLRAPALSGPGVTRRWSDGSSGPTLRVQAAGTYSLQLGTACESRSSSRTVAYASCLFIPNVVTPNADQLNDRFVIQGLTRGDWALTLYNRWGRQVYHTNVYKQDWGAEAETGLYYYLLQQASTNTTYKGWLEVIR
jgi:hypothetical protein